MKNLPLISMSVSALCFGTLFFFDEHELKKARANATESMRIAKDALDAAHSWQSAALGCKEILESRPLR